MLCSIIKSSFVKVHKKILRSAPPSREVRSLLVAAFPIFSDPRRMAILPPDREGLWGVGGVDFFDFSVHHRA